MRKLRKKRMILFLMIAVLFTCGLSAPIGYSTLWKQLFGESYHMGRFVLGEDPFRVTLKDYEDAMLVFVDTELERKSSIVNIKTGKPVEIHRSVVYKISLTTWKDFVADVTRIDKRIDEKLEEIRSIK